MIWQALKQDKDGRVEQAIKDGILRWHALPFTTHTELMNSELFEYGVSLSKKLDERFGKTTVGAKMTDVPGHTLGMIPILKRNGVRFLHIGVNPATPLPPVPSVFRWRCGEDEITVMYQGDYGEDQAFDDFVVCFAHTGDNLGPQSAQAIVDLYDQLSQKYPDHTVKASSLDELALRLEAMSDLPVIDREIGDLWIHGGGTDPQKVSRYRRLLRHMESIGEVSEDLSDNLLCVPEHTWGMDVKTYFWYEHSYTHREMERLREERQVIERSWQEQRDYVTRAERLLGVPSEYPMKKDDLTEYEPIECPASLPYEISWQLFDNADYDRYRDTYLRCHLPWAIQDNIKVGLGDYEGGVYSARVTEAYRKGNEHLYVLSFDAALAEEQGLPYFHLKVEDEKIEIRWFGKKASRLPQAFWFKLVEEQEKWELHKMGQWINPEDVLGSPLISGIDKGVRNDFVTVESWDCTLVAPFGRKLLQYNTPTERQDLYFNLYNNVWNTNFPMWYSDDALFRFFVRKR